MRSRRRQYFVVVAYDVVSDERRTRLHRKLRDFGTPVQYSVFECILDEGSLKRLITTVRRSICEEDTARIYLLCEHCRKRTVVVNSKITELPQAFVI